MTSLAIMGLLPSAARVEAGEILLDGEDLLAKSQREMQRLRGKRLAMVMQDPMTALDPCFTVASQVAQPLRQHRGLSGRKLDARSSKRWSRCGSRPLATGCASTRISFLVACASGSPAR